MASGTTGDAPTHVVGTTAGEDEPAAVDGGIWRGRS